MKTRLTRSTSTDTLFPYTTLFRSWKERHDEEVSDRIHRVGGCGSGGVADPGGRPAPPPRPRLSLAGRSRQPQLEPVQPRSEEHTSELQSLMPISYAVFCLKKNKQQ